MASKCLKKTMTCYQGRRHSVWVVLVALWLTACSSKPPPDNRAQSVHVTLQTAKDVNPNENGKPSPVRVTLYQLTLSDEFLASDFFGLSDGTEAKNQTHKSYDAIMVPGEKKEITLPVNQETTAIGVVTAYRDISAAEWRVFYIIPPRPETPWYSNWWSSNDAWQPNMLVRMEHLTTSIKIMD
ncbi:type VI secretion system lipoprotein TssJ [Serratia sp. UGAL515B_01]|uniref:type VI secretion system lipoprotein TssJ n=1 Tax=Serratia sp. UGAL515B_01 TaxID=2986763 RepID=UPI002952F2F6|nr:type VI secretion system lipoprotein TssJ [Serratia sp. UGAL515B_01]WON77486.1 type VI secretion system lipoprotein TssJ [Serratia sp. UGAL515B_01]WON77506.1 type VI secretion system lipoprotein TssJ [Serratia sp. UGAL515B_01]